MPDIVGMCLALKSKKEALDRLLDSVKVANKEFEAASNSVLMYAKSQGLDFHVSNAWPFAKVLLSATHWDQDVPEGAKLNDEDLSGLTKKDA